MHQHLHLTPGLLDSEAATPLPSHRASGILALDENLFLGGRASDKLGLFVRSEKSVRVMVNISWYYNLSICFFINHRKHFNFYCSKTSVITAYCLGDSSHYESYGLRFIDGTKEMGNQPGIFPFLVLGSLPIGF